MNAQTPLPKLTGEYELLSGPDQTRCQSVLRWLCEEGAISAIVALSAKPHVACVHCSGWVSSSIDPDLRDLGELE